MLPLPEGETERISVVSEIGDVWYEDLTLTEIRPSPMLTKRRRQ